QPPLAPKDLIGTAYWAYTAGLLAEMAGALGRMEEADRLRSLHDRVSQAFRKTFVQADGEVGNDSQTGYVLALKFKLLPEDLPTAAVDAWAASIRNRGGALSTGILGTQFVLDVLAEAGMRDLAYDLLLRTEYPSWGFMIQNGATGIWEYWYRSGDSKNQPAL